MRTLKESLLGDLDINMKSGSEIAKTAKAELDNLKSIVKSINRFETSTGLDKRKYIAVEIPHLLDVLNYKGKIMELSIRKWNSKIDNDYFHIELKVDVYADGNTKDYYGYADEEKIFSNCIRFGKKYDDPKQSRVDFTIADILKLVVRPACKNIESFKKLLNTIQHNDKREYINDEIKTII